jgi:hypothetical protein
MNTSLVLFQAKIYYSSYFTNVLRYVYICVL